MRTFQPQISQLEANLAKRSLQKDLEYLSSTEGRAAMLEAGPGRLMGLAGRAVFISAYAAQRAGLPGDDPRVWNTRMAALSLGSLYEVPKMISEVRIVIRAGLDAASDMLVSLKPMDLALGSNRLEHLLQVDGGMRVGQILQALS